MLDVLSQQEKVWIKWLQACVHEASHQLKGSRIFEFDKVQELLERKNKNIYDLSLGKEIFELWQDKEGMSYQWIDGEWMLLQGLYFYACGPLPEENYAINKKYWGKPWETTRTLNKSYHVTELMNQSIKIIDFLIHGMVGLLSLDKGGASNPESLVPGIRQKFEDLFSECSKPEDLFSDLQPSKPKKRSTKKKAQTNE